jgi:hypothetical protein
MKGILKTIIDFFPFCIKPNWTTENNNKTIVKLVTTVLFIMLITLINLLTIYLIKQLPYSCFLEFKNPIQTSTFLLMCALFLGPILEEIIFRLPLIYSRVNISISIGVLIGFYITTLFHSIYSNYLILLAKLIVAIIVFGLLYFTLKYFKNLDILLQNLFSKYRNIVFYILVLLFCLLHLANLVYLSSDLFVIILLYLTPKLIGGLICSYLRIKFGLKYSIFVHIGNNSIGTILLWI